LWSHSGLTRFSSWGVPAAAGGRIGGTPVAEEAAAPWWYNEVGFRGTEEKTMTVFARIAWLTWACFLAAGAGCAGEEEPGIPGGAPESPNPGNANDSSGGTPPIDSSGTPDSSATTVICEANATLFLGEYGITNNMHGKYRLIPGDTYEQCISIVNGGFPVSWRWTVLTDQPFVKGFPQVFFGINPWTQIATTDKLPVRVADIRTLRVRHLGGVKADGLYNLAFDLWFTLDDTPNENERVLEVMIWLAGTMDPGADAGIGETTIDGADYGIYRMEAPGEPLLLIYVSDQPRPDGWTDLYLFLGDVVSRGFLSTGAYLSTIELGTEMWRGRGIATVGAFSVDLEKK
jgi:hypothetical protein